MLQSFWTAAAAVKYVDLVIFMGEFLPLQFAIRAIRAYYGHIAQYSTKSVRYCTNLILSRYFNTLFQMYVFSHI